MRERRDELIDAALELFSTRPADAVSVEDVASRAGASRALVYHYFGTKKELYIAALRPPASFRRRSLLRLRACHRHPAGPGLRITLRSWLSGAETAGMDWLEPRDMPRAALETMLTGQMAALLRVAGRYDTEVACLAGRADGRGTALSEPASARVAGSR